MKTLVLIVLLTAAIHEGSAHFHVLSGRTFFPFIQFSKFANLQQELNSLTTRVSSLESSFAALQNSVMTVQNALGNFRSRCPSSATDAAKVGDLCYSLETMALTYPQAKNICFQKGGILAEPRTNDETFFQRIKSALPMQTSAVSGMQIYLQIITGTTTFIYESTGIEISNNDIRWDTTPATPTANDAAALISSGANDWKLVEVDDRTAEALPFLCQYNTVF